MDYVEHNRRVWDKNADEAHIWSTPVSSEVIENARKGIWSSIVLTPTKPVPAQWFPDNLHGKKVLCLASGGGQQGPVMAALGADVTVFDNSLKQLHQDEFVANRDGLSITTVQGDMRDLSVFANEMFELIIHPFSNSYIDNVLPVWKEAYRVLKKGGSLLSGFGNPIECVFDRAALENGQFVARHKIPYSDLTSIPKEELDRIKDGGICFGHTLEDQIQGQIDAGFLIAGFYEDTCWSALNEYINTSIATRAIKP